MTSHASQKERLRKMIKKAPLLSGSAHQLLAIVNNKDHELQDIVAIIKHDATLTAYILKVVNSAAYSRGNTISALDRAVSMLGENVIISVVLSEAATPFFESDLSGYLGVKGDLWSHNLCTAVAARLVAHRTKSTIEPEVAFTCGLLHDLGKALLSPLLGNSPDKIIKAIDDGRISDYVNAEQRLLGFDHSLAGYELARHWQLPQSILDVIRFHHSPADAPSENQALVYCIHLGDIIAMMSGATTGADAMQYHLDKGYSAFLQLTDAEIGVLILEVNDEYMQIKTSLEQSNS